MNNKRVLITFLNYNTLKNVRNIIYNKRMLITFFNQHTLKNVRKIMNNKRILIKFFNQHTLRNLRKIISDEHQLQMKYLKVYVQKTLAICREVMNSLIRITLFFAKLRKVCNSDCYQFICISLSNSANRFRVSDFPSYTQRKLFEILLNQPEIRLILIQTDVRLAPNQLENGKLNLISG